MSNVVEKVINWSVFGSYISTHLLTINNIDSDKLDPLPTFFMSLILGQIFRTLRKSQVVAVGFSKTQIVLLLWLLMVTIVIPILSVHFYNTAHSYGRKHSRDIKPFGFYSKKAIRLINDPELSAKLPPICHRLAVGDLYRYFYCLYCHKKTVSCAELMVASVRVYRRLWRGGAEEFVRWKMGKRTDTPLKLKTSFRSLN